MVQPTDVQVYLGGEAVSRSAVQRWESSRAKAVLRKLGSRIGSRGMAEILGDSGLGAMAGPEAQRAALVKLKSGLGHAGIYSILARDLAVSERVSRLAVRASGGRSALSAIRIVAHDISAESFRTWFDGLTATNAVDELVGACPDHYLLRGLPDGRQEVVETTGGSPMATRFVIDYALAEDVPVPSRPEYPVQIAGLALLDDGLPIGGVRHQFRNIDGSMEAQLAVAFPRALPPWMIAAHRWHLAAEFSNWIIRCRHVGGLSTR